MASLPDGAARRIRRNVARSGRRAAGRRASVEDRGGEVYSYRVSEVFLAEPGESWVMGRLRDRDIVTLQTCTPIPTFEKRLIVRADRI